MATLQSVPAQMCNPAKSAIVGLKSYFPRQKMKLPSSAIALTLMFGTILVNAPVQPVTAAPRHTKDQQSFVNKPARVPSRQDFCPLKEDCEIPEPNLDQDTLMRGNESNKPLHFMNNFPTTLGALEKGAFSQLKIKADSFLELVKNPEPLLEAVKNPKPLLPYLRYQPKPGLNFSPYPFHVMP